MQIIDSYKLIGPNRRAEQTVIEVWIQLTGAELGILESRAKELQTRVGNRLGELEIIYTADSLPLTGSGAQQYAAIFCHTALALQQHAGHRVSFQATYPGGANDTGVFAVEFEHGEAGLDAVRLAKLLLEEVIPGVRKNEAGPSQSSPLDDQVQAFLAAAPAQLLPQQTQDIIDAAERFDIPWVKLDRDPYKGLKGDFRVCPNGMLKLGHACVHRILDGSFAIETDETIAQLVHDRAMVRGALESLGASMPPAHACNSVAQAISAAGQIGFPVIVKPRRISRSLSYGAVSSPLDDQAAVAEMAEQAVQACGGAIVEACVPGRSFKALLGDSELLGVFALEGGVAVADETDRIHGSTRTWLTGLSRRLGVPLMTVTLVSADPAIPLEQEGHVVSMDVAPPLDDFLPTDGEFPAESMRNMAAESLLRNLFPEGQPSRIPLISITGTNGKSTVSTMIARVMQQQGFHVGRATTTGIYINNEQLDAGDFAGGKAHHRILESPEVNLAVLETARGGVTGLGLMFDHSDVSVCTNVSADHLGERGIETVEQMAELKRFIVNRARKAVVLNADDAHCVAMLSHLDGRQAWMVSTRSAAEELRSQFGEETKFCIAEPTESGEWITLHDSTGSVRLMPVSEIPATFNGAARFNVSNALQAIAASFQAGASIENIRKAMSEYRTDFETCPGRLNFYDELPFRVLYDNAQNDNGHAALLQIVNGLEVSGRKILAVTRRGDTSDENIFRLASIIADGYDFFMVYDHPKLFAREPGEISERLKQGLQKSGVAESMIRIIGRENPVEAALQACEPGDMLVYMNTTARLHADWERIRNYNP